jgi:hypothetical protein
MKFKAVRLKQPDTFVVLHYRIFARKNGKWKAEFRDDIVRIPINSGISRIDGDNHSVRLIAGEYRMLSRLSIVLMIVLATGRPHRQVEPGMFFWDESDKLLRGNVLMNEPSESRLDRLGWFRWEAGEWTIRQGLEKITQAQHVSVQSCKAQRYRFSFIAEQFILMPTVSGEEETRSYNLGNFTQHEKWVQAIEVGDRNVNIVHAEGTELSVMISFLFSLIIDLQLNVRTKTRLNLVVHTSEFADFNGTIQMDGDSNSYMNLTFYVG